MPVVLGPAVENRLDPISVVAHYCGMEVDTARRHNKKKWSNYQKCEQKRVTG